MRIKTKIFVLFGIILGLQILVSTVILKNVFVVGERQKCIVHQENNLVVIGKIRNQVGRQLMLSLLYAITGERSYRLKFERSDQAVQRFLTEWSHPDAERDEIEVIRSKYSQFQEKNRRLFRFIGTTNRSQGYQVFNQEILSDFAATEGQFLGRILKEKIGKIDSASDELLLSAGFFPVGKAELKKEMHLARKVYGYSVNLNETFSYINRYLTNAALIFLSGADSEKFKESILGIQFDFILHEWEEALGTFPNPDTFLRIEGKSFFEDVKGALLHIQQKVATAKDKMRAGKIDEATHIFIKSIETVVDFILYPTIDSAINESNLLIFKMDAEIERTISFSRNVTIVLLLLFNMVILITSIRFLRELNHSFGMILEKLHRFSFKKEKLTLDDEEINEIELLFDRKEDEFTDLVRKNSFFEKIADSMKAPVFIVSSGFSVQRANQAFFSVLGYTPDDLPSLQLGEVFPGVSAPPTGDLEDIFIKRGGPEGNYSLVKAGGGRVPVLMSTSFVGGTEQQSSCGVFVAQVLDDAVKDQPDSTSHLLSTPHEKTSGLIVGGLVNEYSRSIKNTLGYLRFMLENQKEELSVNVAGNLENLSREIKAGARFSENLSGLISHDKGKKEKLRVNAAVKDTLKRLVDKKNGSRRAISGDYDELNPHIVFIREQLDFLLSVLVEVLSHSAFSKGGNEALHLKTLLEGEVVKIILSEPVDHFPVQYSSVSEILGMLKGYPLNLLTGLLMVSSIMKDCGGTIVAWRKIIDQQGGKPEGVALKFVVEIPLYTEEVSHGSVLADKGSEPAIFSFKGRRILIVDDEKTIRNWLQALVASHDGIPTSCENGAEAIEKLKENTFDLIISDLNMPEVSGYDLGEWLEKESSLMLKRFILITGLRDKELEEYCLKKRCHFLTKPVRSEALLELATELIK